MRSKKRKENLQMRILYVCDIIEIQPDFRELFELFNAHLVEYVIVGGYALEAD